MSETPKFNPEEKITRRDFLRWMKDAAFAIGAMSAAGSFLKDHSNLQPSADIFEPDNPDDNMCVPSEVNSEIEEIDFIDDDPGEFEYLSELSFPAMRNELLKYTERNPKLRAEYDRITKTEATINYAIQFSAHKKGMEKKFSRVLNNERYRRKINNLIIKYCNEFKVPYSIAYGVAATESGFNCDAVNPSGAKGVFQILTDFSKKEGYNRPGLNPVEQNIFWGIKYLRELYDKYGQWAIAAMVYCTKPHEFENKIQSAVKVKFEADKDTWPQYFKRHNINAITLYSRKYFRLGGSHPVQYPFYNLALAEIGEGIMRGKIKKDNLPDLVSPDIFREVCRLYPQVKARIIRKIGVARTNEIFRRLNVE